LREEPQPIMPRGGKGSVMNVFKCYSNYSKRHYKANPGFLELKKYFYPAGEKEAYVFWQMGEKKTAEKKLRKRQPYRNMTGNSINYQGKRSRLTIIFRKWLKYPRDTEWARCPARGELMRQIKKEGRSRKPVEKRRGLRGKRELPGPW